MSLLDPHQVRIPTREASEADEAAEVSVKGRLLATIEPATTEEVMAVFDASVAGEDGRSNWLWLRLPNGDLIFGCFPQGDTYEKINQTMLKGRV